MIISLRTFINTTLFWLLLFLIFVLYTNIRNPVPAQKFMDMIGWSKLVHSNAGGYLSSDQLIINKLANIEQICSKSIRLYMYDQPSMLPAYTNGGWYPQSNNGSSNTLVAPANVIVPSLVSTGIVPTIDNSTILTTGS